MTTTDTAESYTVNYQITIEDYLAASRFMLDNTVGGRGLLKRHYVWRITGALVVDVIGACVLLAMKSPIPLIVLTVLGAFTLSMFSMKWRIVRSILKGVRRHTDALDKGPFLPITFSIDCEGVSSKNEIGQSRSLWQAFETIGQDASYVYLFFAAFKFYVIPKRFFSTPQDASAFFTAAHAWYLAATKQGS